MEEGRTYGDGFVYWCMIKVTRWKSSIWVDEHEIVMVLIINSVGRRGGTIYGMAEKASAENSL